MNAGLMDGDLVVDVGDGRLHVTRPVGPVQNLQVERRFDDLVAGARVPEHGEQHEQDDQNREQRGQHPDVLPEWDLALSDDNGGQMHKMFNVICVTF